MKSQPDPAEECNPSKRSLHGLDWLYFFLADIQTGVGPFLAVYLATQRWNPEQVGIALTIGGLAGVVTQIPAGAVVDRAHRKRLLVVAGLIALVAGSLLLALWPKFSVVVAGQILIGGTGALLVPTANAITLGLVGAAAFDRRFGRNQSFNSAGNVFAAVLMGSVGYFLSARGIFFAVPLLAVPCVIALFSISNKEIGFERSRGAAENDKGKAGVSGIRSLLKNRTLLLFAGCTFLFHFSNAAMLPLLGQMLAHGRRAEAAPFMSACVVVTQLVIAVSAAWIGRKAARVGRKPLLLIGFGVLPIRGALYTLTGSIPFLIGIQFLDGVANTIFGVVSILVVADLTRGTGRFNLAQGGLATAVGIGASVSTTYAGVLVEHFGYTVGFLGLAGVAVFAWLLLWIKMPETLRQGKPAKEVG
ncbi:MAG: MFS transporter [Bryobacteraceae bacterium]